MPTPVSPLLSAALWPEGAPGALGTADQDIPTLTAYLPDPDKATGAAMVILPGGGYWILAPHEAEPYAQWFADHGIAAFVLKYRLAAHGYHHPCMHQDATRAVRMVRSKAQEWKIDPTSVGIIGCSAGGHLASSVLTHYDLGNPQAADVIERQSSRPDLGILCYAVLSMTAPFIKEAGTLKNLLGENPSPDLCEYLSSEKQVTVDTPPCFIWNTWEDTVVKLEHSVSFAMALREKGVRCDLHIYEKGPHGIGLAGKYPGPYHPWTSDCLFWLKEKGFVR